MKRLCVFAHWDRDNLIDDYVIYYLKALKEICEIIIFVSDCNLEENETKKLQGIVEFVLAKKHGEYDFGSYKKGFLYAKDNEIEFDELLLVNDSCFGPFYSLKPIFHDMSKRKCDYWGLTYNSYGIKKTNDKLQICYTPHIQSYFMVLKNNTFNTFENFIKNVKKETTKEEVVINYEMGLSKTLRNAGFKGDFYFKNYSYTCNPVGYKWNILIEKCKFPFLKTSIPKFGLVPFGEQKDFEKIIPDSYPFYLIEEQIKRFKQNFECQYKTMSLREKFLLKISLTCPIFIYMIFNFIDKKIICSICRFSRFVYNKLLHLHHK